MCGTVSDQLEGRNPVLECLSRGKRRVRKILLDDGRVLMPRSHAFACWPRRRGSRSCRRPGQLDRMADGRVHNGVIAVVDALPSWTTRQLIDKIFDDGDFPFLLLADEVNYEHNLGALLRSGLGFGVQAWFFRRAESLAVARGAAGGHGGSRRGSCRQRGPQRRSSTSRRQVCVSWAPTWAASLWGRSTCGPIALVMGGESKGLSPTLRKKCDEVVSVPLAGELESLNVSVAGALLMYEKRQDGWYSRADNALVSGTHRASRIHDASARVVAASVGRSHGDVPCSVMGTCRRGLYGARSSAWCDDLRCLRSCPSQSRGGGARGVTRAVPTRGASVLGAAADAGCRTA